MTQKAVTADRVRMARRHVGHRSSAAVYGYVAGVSGLAADVAGLGSHLAVGDRIMLSTRSGDYLNSEVVGFRHGRAQAMVFGSLDGIGPGSAALARRTILAGSSERGPQIPISPSCLGRIIDPFGNPIDGRGELGSRSCLRPVRVAAPEAATRARLGARLDLGVRVLDVFTTCREGQRLGLFAGSGVGKSTLLAMLARHTASDIAVIALVGERGREVREFVEDELRSEGLSRSVIVVATSDSPPLMRREAAYTAMAVAEYFRDQGRSVLLMVDSVTRFCLALREIGLSSGEPPATRGYPPSVFAELPKLLERAGPGPDRTGSRPGYITGLFTVLVEGDDHNEPIADAVRGILDGHVILDRRIGESGRYPAVDILRSLSRSVPGCLSSQEFELAKNARAILALHAEVADLVRLGAYRTGSDPAVDEALLLAPRIERIFRQPRDERTDAGEAFMLLSQALATTDHAA